MSAFGVLGRLSGLSRDDLRIKRQRGGDVSRPPRLCVLSIVMRDILDRPGNDLLSRVLRHSTISAEEFNGRVRDGIGFWLLAQATGPAKDMASAKRQRSVPDLIRDPRLGFRKMVFPCGALVEHPFRVVVSRTLIMRTIKPIEQLVPVS